MLAFFAPPPHGPSLNLRLVPFGSSRVGEGKYEAQRPQGTHHALPDYRGRSIGLSHAADGV
jgi:hypothetical protein